MQEHYLTPSKAIDLNPSEIRPSIGGTPSQLVPFLLWLAALTWVIRVTVFVRQRSGSEFSAIDLLAGVQIFMVLSSLAIMVLSGRMILVWAKTGGTSIRMLIFYSFACAFSAVWSPLPQFSLYRAIEYATFLMSISVALSYKPNFLKAERTVLFSSIIVILVSMSVSIKFKGLTAFSSLESWHTNSYTASAAIIACYCLGEYFSSDKYRKKALKWYGTLAFAALIIGTSTASFIAALAGIGIIALHYRNFALIGIISGGSLILLFTVLLGSEINTEGLKEFFFHGMSEKNIYNFHGRLPMWQGFLELVQQSPLYGHGFAVISTGRDTVFSTTPHNSLFSILLGTGLLGLFIAMVYGARAIKEFIQTIRLDLPGALGCSAGLSAALINSLAMPLVFDEWEESSLVFASVTALMVLFVYLPYKQRKIEDSAPTAEEVPTEIQFQQPRYPRGIN